MKKLYEFVLYREEEVTKVEESKNEQGDVVKVEKKVKENVPKKFFLRKPNRSLIDQSDLFYAVKVAEAVKAGLLTTAQLYKRFANDGGILSDPEKDRLLYLNNKLTELQMDFQRLMAKTEKNAADEEQLRKYLSELSDVRSELQRFELSQSSLFEQTAESRARNHTILWFILNLSYDEHEKPVFGEGSFEDKLKKYDEIEDAEDDFYQLLLRKLFVLVSFWYMGRAVTADDFKQIDDASSNVEE